MAVKTKPWVGWREWVALPELGIVAIKAKIDTGARNSALHAFKLEQFEEDGRLRVRFSVHPLQDCKDKTVVCVADVVDERWVSNSTGHRERRLVIRTPVQVGKRSWPIEITLTNRSSMTFRMLMGRTALQGRLLIDPEASYLLKTVAAVPRAAGKKPGTKLTAQQSKGKRS
ncbi:MAG: ATP-dependent zinc protease [Gammaproteobacteria bacterium]